MSLKRQNYSWWRFFDKAGDNCNFTYNEDLDKWTGTIYLDKVSTDLIEYEPLYVLQEAETPVPMNAGNLYSPKKLNLSSWCPGATYNNILARWKDTEAGSTYSNVPELFLWSIENYPGPTPTVIKHDSLDITLDSNALDLVGPVIPPVGGLTGGTGQAVGTSPGSTWNAEALSIRVGLQSKNEDSYSRTLQLIDPNYLYEIGPSPNNFGCTAGIGVTSIGATHVFAEITFYGETEGEDDRLETMIENFGSTINNSDFKIFDDVDINEILPDYIKLNAKRKELLLEWDNIFPFTGSYKALINILKWFGYDQVTLKEYWLNIDEYLGKNEAEESRIRYKQTPIEDLFSTEPKTALMGDATMIPNKVYKKTSKFGLFYDITRDSGSFDDDGIPIVEEAFLFSNEEVLIKLFALKQKLKNYFLPLNARIVDIIGEAVYYARYDVNIWNDVCRIDDIELNINPCVKFMPEDGCSLITDLAPNNFIGIKIPPNLNMAGNTPFLVEQFGFTANNIGGIPLNNAAYGDTWTWTDQVTGATLTYTNTLVGATLGQIISGMADLWNSQTIEPFSSFQAMTGATGTDEWGVIVSWPGGTASTNGPTATMNIGTYEWLTVTQTSIVGPTGGSGLGPIVGGAPTGALSFWTVSASPGATNVGGTHGLPAFGSVPPAYPIIWHLLGDGPLAQYSSAFMGWFGNSNRSIYDLPDDPCAPIAAPFVLENCSFELNWEDAKVTYNQVDWVPTLAGPTQYLNFSGYDYTYIESSYPLGSTNSYGQTSTVSEGSVFDPPNFGNSGWPFYNTGTYTWGPYLPGCTFGCGPTPGSPYNWNGGPTMNFGMTSSILGPTATFTPWNNPVVYNWNNIGNGNFYELEWIITHDTSDYTVESGLLRLEDGNQFPILLDLTGTYTVELRIYDSTGGFSRWIEKAALCVNTKDLDFIGHYRSRVCDYQWDTKTITRQSDIVPAPPKPNLPTYEMYNSTWNLPVQENEQMSMQDLTYNDLDRIEFYQTQNDPANQGYCDSIATLPLIPGTEPSSGLNDLDAYKWNLIEDTATWAEMCHLWWDITGPKITQISLSGGPGLIPWDLGPNIALNYYDNYIILVDESIYKTPNSVNSFVRTVPNINQIIANTNSTYGDYIINMDPLGDGYPTNVYQYQGGGLGVIGGTSWVKVDVTGEIDWIGIQDPSFGGTLTTPILQIKEVVRQINMELETNPGYTAHPLFDKYITYYEEEYQDPLNPLVPYIRFVSKKQSTNKKHKLQIFSANTSSNPMTGILLVDQSTNAADYELYSYISKNFGDMGDIPVTFEIFAVGASGGVITIPGPSTWLDNYGNEVNGITGWNYGFTATGISALYTALTNVSQGLNISGTGASGVTGPILNYGFNMVYGASGYTGGTGPTAQPPSGLVPIKIQASIDYFSSYDDQCVSFTASGVTGATSWVLGGTSGIAGTMCGRSITSNSTWNTLRIHKYTSEFTIITQIQFNYSLSPMEGKTYPSWTLIKENDNNWENIYYNNPYFSYLFTQKGSYTLELNVTDNNGNSKTKTKKEFIKII